MTRLDQIQTILDENHQPKFRFEQIKSAIFSSNISRYSQISNISPKLKEQIIAALGDEILSLSIVNEIKGRQAHKVLFTTKDHHQIESVRLTYHQKDGSLRHSLCISTQSGCALGCLFCATGAIGFKKNLTADEILDQVLYFIKKNLPIDSIIFMGMGEPLANSDNTFEAIKQMTAPDLLAMSERRLSLSTVGLVPGIERLTREHPNVNLAFSLHNPFNDERLKLMPVTAAYPIEKVLTTIDYHLEATNHKVFIAYILLKDINDSPRHAQALADLIKLSPNRLKLLHVNLIRYNSISAHDPYQKPDRNIIANFQNILTQNKVHHTLRADFGTDIKAACGQLAADYQSRKVANTGP